MSTEKLVGLLREADIIIGFDPLPDEPDYKTFLSTHNIPNPQEVISQDKNSSPEEVAQTYIQGYQGKKVLILVPGQRFDATGTRHGRGGGWYDRFLKSIPKEWVRVGVARLSHIHKTPLIRETWDQPMNYVLVLENGVPNVIEC